MIVIYLFPHLVEFFLGTIIPGILCKSLTKFTILTASCKACGKCSKACPTEAISGGAKKVPALIDQVKCVKCGSCRDVCPFDAVGTE